MSERIPIVFIVFQQADFVKQYSATDVGQREFVDTLFERHHRCGRREDFHLIVELARGEEQHIGVAVVDTESAQRATVPTVGVAYGEEVVAGRGDVDIAGDAGVVACGELYIVVAVADPL